MQEEYYGRIAVYVSETNEKPSEAMGKYYVTVPAKGKATRTIRVSPTSEKLYVWVDDEFGNCILDGYELSTVTHDAPVLAITSSKTNATEGLYEAENAYYQTWPTKILMKAPCTNEDKATFTYEIKNTGGRTHRTFLLSLTGLPDHRNTKFIRKALTLEPNSVNYITVEATPEEIGSRFIQCRLTMEGEKDGEKLKSEGEIHLIECIGGICHGYLSIYSDELLVYVRGGGATGIQQPTTDDIFANGKTVKVYNLQGTLVDGSATRESFEKLPQGIYIVNGRKVLKK